MNNYQTYLTRLADDRFILSHRLAEWCGKAPILETDIALTNISLDLIGQATMAYKELAKLQETHEDDIAFLRKEKEYVNALICEAPNGDFGFSIARQYLYDQFHFIYLTYLKSSTDPFLKAFAEKSIKEVAYHLKFSKDWMLRLGDGTEESNRRITEGLSDAWKYIGDLFYTDEVEEAIQKEFNTPNLALVEEAWIVAVQETLKDAKIEAPANKFKLEGGRKGIHTEAMGYILTDVQFIPKLYPGARW